MINIKKGQINRWGNNHLIKKQKQIYNRKVCRCARANEGHEMKYKVQYDATYPNVKAIWN